MSVLEEDKGVIKSGLIAAAFAPVKAKKQYYAVLGERALELHESEKTYRKRKTPKHLIDLAISFNVGNEHFDPKLKKCVCLMGPDETLVLKGDTDQQSTEWYEAIMGAIIPARALRLGRPVFSNEFFEFAWDVEVVDRLKLKKPPKNDEGMPTISQKMDGVLGLRRLCFYAHTIVLCKRKIEPAHINVPKSGIPPFQENDFIELHRKFLATFGCQEKYFHMTMGRGSAMGACNIYCLCETDEVATDIYSKLNRIIDREAEKKKQMNNGAPVLPAPYTYHIRSHTRDHRQRSNTQPIRPRTGSGIHGLDPIGTHSVNNSARERRAKLRDQKALVDSFEEEEQRIRLAQQRRESRTSLSGAHQSSFHLDLTRRVGSPASFSGSIGRKPSSGTPVTLGFGSPFNVTPTSSHNQRFGSVGSKSVFSTSITTPHYPNMRRQSASIKEETNQYRSMGLGGCMDFSAQSIARQQQQQKAASSNAEETEDSGGTLRLDAGSTRGDGDGTSINSRRGIDSLAERLKNTEQTSSEDGLSTGQSSSSALEEYATMDHADWTIGHENGKPVHVKSREVYHLEEVRSYISDSSDSCYSSIAKNTSKDQLPTNLPNQPRAYSFGANTIRPTAAAAPASAGSLTDHKDIPQGSQTARNLMPPPEDPRKRAFSLGSKSFFNFKLPKYGRPSRHPQNASGMSLGSSSTGSSLGPPSSSSTNHISNLGSFSGDADGIRNRSGSFGSGRSTPYNRRGGSSMSAQASEKQAVDSSRDHLVEIDFGGLGRSGSGSVHSVDSPSSCSFRSRTSSFGCKNEFTGLTILNDPYDQGPKPSDILLLEQQKQEAAALAAQNAEPFKSTPIEDDYIMTKPPDMNILNPSASLDEDEDVMKHSYAMSGMLPQHFETIQETTSGKSSRCSSRNSNDAKCEEEDDYAPMELTAAALKNIQESNVGVVLAEVHADSCPMEEDDPLLLPSQSSTSSLSQKSQRRGERSRSRSPRAAKNPKTEVQTEDMDPQAVPAPTSSHKSVFAAAKEFLVPKPFATQRVRSAADATAVTSPLTAITKVKSVPNIATDEESDLNYAFVQLTASDQKSSITKATRKRSRSSACGKSDAPYFSQPKPAYLPLSTPAPTHPPTDTGDYA